MTRCCRYRRRTNVLIAISLVAILAAFWFARQPPRVFPEANNDPAVDDQPTGNASRGSETTFESPGIGEEVQLSRTVESSARDSDLEKYREQVHRLYPDLAMVLELDYFASQQLVDLLADHLREAAENPPFVREGELEWDEHDKPDWVRETEARQTRHDREVSSLLNESQFEVWKHYSRTNEARRLVYQLRARLDGTPDSLAGGQTTPLVDAIAERQQRFIADESASLNPRGLERFAKYLDRLREGAAPYLSERQMAEFDDVLDEKLQKARDRQQ